MKPRNSFVVCKIIEKTTTQVGAIFVPPSAGGDAYTEALVIDVPAVNASTADLKSGQVVWVQHKVPFRTPEGEKLKLAGIPYQSGKLNLVVFEESQIMGIIADNLEEYRGLQRDNHLAQVQQQLLH